MALLVNFLVALVDYSNKRAKEKSTDPDVLQYIGKSVSKLREKKFKRNHIYLKYQYKED